MQIHMTKIYTESFSNMWHNRLEWFRVAFAPLVLYLIGLGLLMIFYAAAGASVGMTEIMTGHFFSVASTTSGALLIGIGHLIYLILSFIASYCIIINGYRYAVLNEGGDKWWTLHLDIRFIRVLIYAIFIGILFFIYSSAVGGIIYGFHILFESTMLNVILGLAFGILGIYLFFRIGLTLLVASLDKSHAIRTSWELLRQNVWQFFWLNIFIAGTMLIATGVGFGILSIIGLAGTSVLVITSILGVAFSIFMWLAYWATLSKAYGLIYLSLGGKTK